MIRAGFGIRLGAGAIDAVAMYLSSAVVGGAAAGGLIVSRQRAAAPPLDPRLIVLVTLTMTAVVVLGYSLTEVFGVATPAKRVLKLRIAGADHRPPSVGQRTARWAVKYVPVLLLILGSTLVSVWVQGPAGPLGRRAVIAMMPSVVGMVTSPAVLAGFFLTLSSQRRALHDLVAGTVVLRPGGAPRPGEAQEGFAPLMPTGVDAGALNRAVAAPVPEARGFSNHG